ncbi:MAG: hypothetical protein ACP5UO_06255, partial [Thermoplasmata archaeon]
IAFLGKIRLDNLDGRIMMIMDNFKSHHALNVAKKALELWIDLIFLPLSKLKSYVKSWILKFLPTKIQESING